jgi:amino acid transporter
MLPGVSKGIGFWEASAIGVGGMVGGGIFAVLGLAAELGGGGTPLAFALAGAVALVTSYSYVKLSVTYPSEGGTVHFLVKAFGSGLLSGGLNILLWLSYVVMLALYASAFGSYGASFFGGEAQVAVKHLLITGSVLAITALNLMAAEVIGRAEDWIVALKLAILAFFIAVGVWGIAGQRLAVSTWSPPLQLISGGMIIFVAYEGFELIANTAKDVRDPARTLPRAFYASVGFVVVLYVAVALVTVGNLPLARIADARDYALAEAAKPFLGQVGFTLIAVAALLSTASAINATLYGSGRLAYTIARDGELPRELERKIWHRPLEGLLITSGLTLVAANFLDLSSISTAGSAGFLLIFAGVNTANVRLASRTHSRRWISLLGIAGCLAGLVSIVVVVGGRSPRKLAVLGGLLAVSFGGEAVYRRFRRTTYRADGDNALG